MKLSFMIVGKFRQEFLTTQERHWSKKQKNKINANNHKDRTVVIKK